ncbi:MAG: PA2779 family protein [Thiohalomonadales bacterium]
MIKNKNTPIMKIRSLHTHSCSTRLVAKLVIGCFLWLILQPVAYSGFISTQELMQQGVESTEKLRLRQLLDREDVRLALMDMGVSAQHAQQRINLLTEQEAAKLAADIEQLPAGGGVLEILVLVFLVLLFTDIMGYTDIFPFVNKNNSDKKK